MSQKDTAPTAPSTSAITSAEVWRCTPIAAMSTGMRKAPRWVRAPAVAGSEPRRLRPASRKAPVRKQIAANLAGGGIRSQFDATKTAEATSSRKAPVPATQTAPAREGSREGPTALVRKALVMARACARGAHRGIRRTPYGRLGCPQPATPLLLHPDVGPYDLGLQPTQAPIDEVLPAVHAVLARQRPDLPKEPEVGQLLVEHPLDGVVRLPPRVGIERGPPGVEGGVELVVLQMREVDAQLADRRGIGRV